MKEIKFRAWDKNIKQMVSGYEAYQNGVCGWQNDETGSFIYLRSDRYELMQYTGLKDRNSVEIYESDIVKTAYGVEVIEYYKNGFYFGNPLHDNWDAEDVEVIGNIYENPELIENYPEK